MTTNPPKKPASGVHRDEVQTLIDKRFDTFLAATQKQKEMRWWAHPLFVNVVSVFGSGILAYFVANAQSSKSHNAEDLKRDIAQEVRNQIEPLRKDIEGLRIDVARIKEHTGMSASIVIPADFVKSIPSIRRELADATKRKKALPLPQLEAIRSNLLQVSDKTAPDYWQTLLYVVNFRSRYSLVDPRKIKPADFVMSGAGNMIENQNVGLTGEVVDSTFTNCIVRVVSSVKLRNVRFVNCAFLLPVSVNPDAGQKP